MMEDIQKIVEPYAKDALKMAKVCINNVTSMSVRKRNEAIVKVGVIALAAGLFAGLTSGFCAATLLTPIVFTCAALYFTYEPSLLERGQSFVAGAPSSVASTAQNVADRLNN